MKEWFVEFAGRYPMPYTLLLLGLVSAIGLAIGFIQIRGIGLGVAGVLFAGLLFGHFGFTVDSHLLDFIRDFGLVLFVYSIGVKVGPRFLRSLRSSGLTLNMLALAIILMGGVLTVAIAHWARLDMAVAAGIFSGATTNTPSLGAVQEALKSLGGEHAAQAALPALGYAIAYPFGIVGIILAMILLRLFFRVNMEEELSAIQKEKERAFRPMERRNIALTNAQYEGSAIAEIIGEGKFHVAISRIKHAEENDAHIAHSESVLKQGDIIHAVGTRESLDAFQAAMGERSEIDLLKIPGPLVYRDVIVTNDDVVGRTLEELALEARCNVSITRVKHIDVERTAFPGRRLQFGDIVHVVGEEARIRRVEEILGNSPGRLDKMELIPLFVGIILGVLIGSIPITLPGISVPIRIGIAGGPLLAAMLLSHIGTIGRLHWHMPSSANSALRDLGITLFLASVGLKAGGHFMQTLLNGSGLLWMATGMVITLLPLLLVGIAARLFMKMNFLRICGILAGSMTDPPALAFAILIGKSDVPAISYAAVYPVTMVCRIVIAQMLILMFMK